MYWFLFYYLKTCYFFFFSSWALLRFAEKLQRGVQPCTVLTKLACSVLQEGPPGSPLGQGAAPPSSGVMTTRGWKWLFLLPLNHTRSFGGSWGFIHLGLFGAANVLKLSNEVCPELRAGVYLALSYRAESTEDFSPKSSETEPGCSPWLSLGCGKPPGWSLVMMFIGSFLLEEEPVTYKYFVDIAPCGKWKIVASWKFLTPH